MRTKRVDVRCGPLPQMCLYLSGLINRVQASLVQLMYLRDYNQFHQREGERMIQVQQATLVRTEKHRWKEGPGSSRGIGRS